MRLQLKTAGGLATIVEEHVGVGSAGGDLVAVEGMPLHVVESAFLLGVVEKRGRRGRLVQFKHTDMAFAACCKTRSLGSTPRYAGDKGICGGLDRKRVLRVGNVVEGRGRVLTQVVDQNRT